MLLGEQALQNSLTAPIPEPYSEDCRPRLALQQNELCNTLIHMIVSEASKRVLETNAVARASPRASGPLFLGLLLGKEDLNI